MQKSENSILDYVYIRGKYISIFVSVYKETLKRYTKKLAIMWSGRGGRRLLFMLFFFNHEIMLLTQKSYKEFNATAAINWSNFSRKIGHHVPKDLKIYM